MRIDKLPGFNKVMAHADVVVWFEDAIENADLSTGWGSRAAHRAIVESALAIAGYYAAAGDPWGDGTTNPKAMVMDAINGISSDIRRMQKEMGE